MKHSLHWRGPHLGCALRCTLCTRCGSNSCRNWTGGCGPLWMSRQVLILFIPSRVNAKCILKPINILPVSLIRFSMQRIPHGVQPVCFPTFIGQLHSLCIFKIFQQGFFFCSSITEAGNLVAHSSFGGGIAWGWRGKGLRCGVWRGQPQSQQGICVLHLPLQSEHSYCTLEQLSGVSSDGRM